MLYYAGSGATPVVLDSSNVQLIRTEDCRTKLQTSANNITVGDDAICSVPINSATAMCDVNIVVFVYFI